MPRLRAKQKVTLDVIGDGELRSELGALAVRLGLDRHVRFLGQRPKLEVADRDARGRRVRPAEPRREHAVRAPRGAGVRRAGRRPRASAVCPRYSTRARGVLVEPGSAEALAAGQSRPWPTRLDRYDRAATAATARVSVRQRRDRPAVERCLCAARSVSTDRDGAARKPRAARPQSSPSARCLTPGGDARQPHRPDPARRQRALGSYPAAVGSSTGSSAPFLVGGSRLPSSHFLPRAQDENEARRWVVDALRGARGARARVVSSGSSCYAIRSPRRTNNHALAGALLLYAPYPFFAFLTAGMPSALIASGRAKLAAALNALNGVLTVGVVHRRRGRLADYPKHGRRAHASRRQRSR